MYLRFWPWYRGWYDIQWWMVGRMSTLIWGREGRGRWYWCSQWWVKLVKRQMKIFYEYCPMSWFISLGCVRFVAVDIPRPLFVLVFWRVFVFGPGPGWDIIGLCVCMLLETWLGQIFFSVHSSSVIMTNVIRCYYFMCVSGLSRRYFNLFVKGHI